MKGPDCLEWTTFRLGDLFVISKGTRLTKAQMIPGKINNPDKAQSFPDVRAPEIEPTEKPITAASKVESLQTCSMVLIIVVAAAFILGIRNRRG